MNAKEKLGTALFVLVATAECVLLHYFQYGLVGLFSIPAVLLAFVVSELFHELGHVLFGACCKIKTVPKISFTGSSSCLIIPKTEKNLKKRIIVTAAGGCVFNFLLIVLGLLAFSVKAIPVWLSVAMPSSIYLLLLNAFPYINKNGKTDGMVIEELIKNDDNAKVMLAVLTVQAQVLKGKPIEEVDEKLLFDLPVIQEDDPAFISLTQLRCEYFAAKGDSEQAEKYRQRLQSLKEEYM